MISVVLEISAFYTFLTEISLEELLNRRMRKGQKNVKNNSNQEKDSKGKNNDLFDIFIHDFLMDF